MGAETHPDYYCCTSGSPDIGPDSLGNDMSLSPYEWQKHNLELLLLASRKQGVPLQRILIKPTGLSQLPESIPFSKLLTWAPM